MTVKEEFKKIDKNAGLKLSIEELYEGYCIDENGKRTYYPLSDRKRIIKKYGKRKVTWTYMQGWYYVFELDKENGENYETRTD